MSGGEIIALHILSFVFVFSMCALALRHAKR